MKTNNKDEFYDLFKDACPIPTGEDDFTERVSKRIVVPDRGYRQGKFRRGVTNIILSPIPMLIAAMVAGLVFWNSIKEHILDVFEKRIEGFDLNNIPFLIIIVSIGAVVSGIIYLWNKLLKEDYSYLDLRKLSENN